MFLLCHSNYVSPKLQEYLSYDKKITRTPTTRTQVHFTPVCLPTFNAGFMQTYVGMLNKDLCLLLFSGTNDPSAAFPQLTKCKEAIDAEMKEYDLYDKIDKSLSERSTTRIEEMKIPGLVHFVYIFRKRSQHFSPTIHGAWNDENSKKRIWKRYKEIYCRFYETMSFEPHQHICDRNDIETLVCTRGENYELLAYVTYCVRVCESLVFIIHTHYATTQVFRAVGRCRVCIEKM